MNRQRKFESSITHPRGIRRRHDAVFRAGLAALEQGGVRVAVAEHFPGTVLTDTKLVVDPDLLLVDI